MIEKFIQAIEEADSAPKLVKAVRDLADAQTTEAIPVLIKVLGYNNPGAAVAAVDGLISLGNIAIPALLEQLDGYNYGARAWAIRVLAGIGDPRGLNLLLDAAANDFALSVRRAAAKGLGNIQWDLLATEEINHAQSQTLATLLKTSQDVEWVVRYAAIVGLQGLAKELLNRQEQTAIDQILNRLTEIIAEDDTLAVKARALLAQQKLTVSGC
ncbi:MAG: HEAT repeat domain-containing protein [Microcoleaceae cyanobacterium]